MTDLTTVLDTLPPSGIRLPRGLALRITKGNGMSVLGCSRVNTPPSDTEMETLVEAVKIVFEPSHLFRARTSSVKELGGVSHHIIRLYWPDEALEFIEAPSYQEDLFGGDL